VKRNPQVRLCNNSKCFTVCVSDTILLFTGSETIILPRQIKTILSHVQGSVTNNNGFWIELLDLLEPLLQLLPIITAHNQWPSKTHSIFTGVSSRSTVTNDERRIPAHSPEWTELTRLKLRGEPNISRHVLQFLWCSVFLSLFFATWKCLPRCCPAMDYSMSIRCAGTCLASRWLAMEFCFGSTLPAFRSHVTTFYKAA
jgi:hypothetical protein